MNMTTALRLFCIVLALLAPAPSLWAAAVAVESCASSCCCGPAESESVDSCPCEADQPVEAPPLTPRTTPPQPSVLHAAAVEFIQVVDLAPNWLPCLVEDPGGHRPPPRRLSCVRTI
jgi:hypothetical protein